MVAGQSPQETDLLVIGGGPGGYTAAFRAAQLGIQTTIVEATESLGGVCLHVGCIPSKTLLWVAELVGLAEHAAQFGIELGKPEVDLDKVREWKTGAIAKLAAGLDSRCKRLGVERVRGWARFEDGQHVAMQGNATSRIRFQRAVIATGAESIRLRDIEIDSPRVMHSAEALKLEDTPRHLLVIGGGYIGLELGSVYAALGSQVTVVEMMPSLLPGVDADLMRPLGRRMKELLAEVCLETKAAGMKEVADGVEVTFEGRNIPRRDTFERVLVSVGRRPNTENLDLSNTQVETDSGGFIKVDDRLRTADPGIYAIGDVVGHPMLAHKASHEGKVCADVIAGRDTRFDARAIPAVVFTDPEIAWCGLTETEAKAAGTKVVVKKAPWGTSGRAVSMGRQDGVTKILFEPQTRQILGVGICGPQAGEMIAEGALAMHMGAAAGDLAATIHPHPTLSEMMGEVADMMEMTTPADK